MPANGSGEPLPASGQVLPASIRFHASQLVGGQADLPIPASANDGTHEFRAEPQARDLDAPPGSVQIALSSLLTFGAWRLMRQARQVRFAPLSDWYHVGGPDQIGRAVRLELDFSRSALPLCWYQPHPVETGDQEVPVYPRQHDTYVRWQQLSFLPTTAPRSPPLVAL